MSICGDFFKATGDSAGKSSLAILLLPGTARDRATGDEGVRGVMGEPYFASEVTAESFSAVNGGDGPGNNSFPCKVSSFDFLGVEESESPSYSSCCLTLLNTSAVLDLGLSDDGNIPGVFFPESPES